MKCQVKKELHKMGVYKLHVHVTAVHNVHVQSLTVRVLLFIPVQWSLRMWTMTKPVKVSFR